MAVSMIKNESTAWANVPNKVSMSTLEYKVKNGIVFVNGYDMGDYTWIANTWQTIGVLPSSARPSKRINASGGTRNGTTYEIQINAAGEIALNPSTSTGWKSFLLSFPLGN